MIKQTLAVIVRLISAILDAVNHKRKKDYTNNVADTLSNGGDVVHSDKTFAELSKQSKRDQPK